MSILPAFTTDDDLARAVDYQQASTAIGLAWNSLSRGGASILARQRTDCGAYKLSTMGAIWQDAGTAGVKTYTTSPGGQFEFVFNLFDISPDGGGRLVASMSGPELTRIRTPALTAYTAMQAAAGKKKLALFGLGVQGRAHLEALATLLPLHEVKVVELQDVGRTCEEMAQRLCTSVKQCSPQDAIRDADIVVTASRSKQPLFDGALLKPGALVVAVGTSVANGRELDDETLRRAARVIVEWKPQSIREAGEVVIGQELGLIDERKIVDLPEILSGRAVWRLTEDEVVVFKTVGVGLTDLAAATQAWSNIRRGKMS